MTALLTLQLWDGARNRPQAKDISNTHFRKTVHARLLKFRCLTFEEEMIKSVVA